MLVQGVDRYARATSARAGKESCSYLCASNVTPMANSLLGICFSVCPNVFHTNDMFANDCNVGRTHFRKNRLKKRQKSSGCRSLLLIYIYIYIYNVIILETHFWALYRSDNVPLWFIFVCKISVLNHGKKKDEERKYRTYHIQYIYQRQRVFRRNQLWFLNERHVKPSNATAITVTQLKGLLRNFGPCVCGPALRKRVRSCRNAVQTLQIIMGDHLRKLNQL